MQVRDDLGEPVAVPATVGSVVSLVPSLTEAVAACDAGLLAAATKYCTHPAWLPAERIGGTKNPDVARIIEIAPDVVLANEEENRVPDLDRLRAAGLAVWVTRIRTLPEALASLERMLTTACPAPQAGLARCGCQRVGGRQAARAPAPGDHPDLAAAVDGARQRYLRW